MEDPRSEILRLEVEGWGWLIAAALEEGELWLRGAGREETGWGARLPLTVGEEG